MAETNPFSVFEAQMDHDFERLQARVLSGYHALDLLAHSNGSVHSDLELLSVETQEDGRHLRVDFDKLLHGAVVVKGRYITEPNGFLYYCNVACEDSDSYPKPGKHSAAPVEPDEQEIHLAPQLSQIDKMVLIAGMLETYQRDAAFGRTQIVAYDR